MADDVVVSDGACDILVGVDELCSNTAIGQQSEYVSADLNHIMTAKKRENTSLPSVIRFHYEVSVY